MWRRRLSSGPQIIEHGYPVHSRRDTRLAPTGRPHAKRSRCRVCGVPGEKETLHSCGERSWPWAWLHEDARTLALGSR